MFGEFQKILDKRHDYAKEWKSRTGGRVAGVICSVVPEELLYAAGMLPVRILGEHVSQTVSARHISSQFCVYCRDILAQGLLGHFDYLDAITHAHSCLHIRQSFSSWQRHLNVPFSHFSYMPANTNNVLRATDILVNELRDFKTALERHIGKTISEAELQEAVDVYNTDRRLLRQLYDMRKENPPLLSGREAMLATLAGLIMDKREHAELLTKILKELPSRKDGPTSMNRVMLVGGVSDDLEFVKMVESLDSVIVVDDNCTGSRYFWNEVVPNGDLLRAIATRYVVRPPCPQKDLGVRRRFKHIMDLIEEWSVQAVIITMFKFCEPHAFDNIPLTKLLKEKGIPALSLEFDVVNPLGQFRIRVEALLEILSLDIE